MKCSDIFFTPQLVTVNVMGLLLPFAFCTLTLFVPGETKWAAVGHRIVPGQARAPITGGKVNAIVWRPLLDEAADSRCI